MNKDILIQPPVSAPTPREPNDDQPFTSRIKEYLSDPRHRIALADLINDEIRTAVHETRTELFPCNDPRITAEDFAVRLRKYEDATKRLSEVVILLGHWGTEDHQGMLAKVIAHLGDNIDPRGGVTALLGLRWYPMMLLMYAGGIAALSAKNYHSLATLLTTPLSTPVTRSERREAIVMTVDGILEVLRAEAFYLLPDHKRNHVPKSEYLFKILQPSLEDLLFLGSSYEDLFDHFEVFQTLVYADLTRASAQHIWGPPGRFCWKDSHAGTRSPFNALVGEAERCGDSWPPLEYGLFGRSSNRFKELAAAYRQSMSRL